MHDFHGGGWIFVGEDDIITTRLRPSRVPKRADPGQKLQSRALQPHHALLVKSDGILWPETLDGTESLPPLTTSTTCGSCRESILGDVPAVKPEPVTSAERLALNSLCIDDSISGPDVERILNDLEPLDLDDLLISMDKLVNEFPALALHMEKGSGGVPAFYPPDQVPDTNPKVLPWLASVDGPEEARSFPEDDFSDLSDYQGYNGVVHSEKVNSGQDHITKVTQGLGYLQLTEFGKVDTSACCSTTSEPDGIDNQNNLLCATDYLNEDNIASIGSYALERLFGPGIEDSLRRPQLEEVVENFIDELVALKLGAEGTSLQLTSLSGGTDPQSAGSFGSSSGGSSLKRKASGGGGGSRSRRPRKDDDDGDDGDGGDAGRRNGGGDGPSGNSKPADPGKGRPLEFMCPYRLKDPIRFNVREWYDCATKVYICEEPGSKRNELNELRRHIKQRHSGPGILSQPYCSACKEEFPSPTLLDEHARRRACAYRELPSSNDPLDGLSPEAERTLRSKQGRQGDSAICQYGQICRIALGDASDVPSPGYLPVIEHFELHDWYLKCLPQLRGAFLRKLPSQLESIVESLLETIQIHTVDVLGQCNNRALRAAGPHKRRKAGAKKTTDASHVPDGPDAVTAVIRPSRATEHRQVAPRPATHQESNLAGNIPTPERSAPGSGRLSTDYISSADLPPLLSLSDTASRDTQQLALHAGANPPPALGDIMPYPSISEPRAPSLGSNPHLDFFTSTCPKMTATSNMWSDEDTDTSCRTNDAFAEFDALLAANGMPQYSAPEVVKEPVGHPPMMFEMGSEYMLGETSLERLIPSEHGEY